MSQHTPPDPTVGLPATDAHGANGGSAASAKADPSRAKNSAEIQGGAAVVHSEVADLSALPPIRLRDAQGEDPTPVAKVASSTHPPAERDPTGRLHFQGEIARGGMGAVLKGHDSHLGRDIAVKVLLQEHQARPDFAQRFVEEAQITGQLQHPGIVPVYELGQFRDQRPFFTMKLVKGKTLAAILEARKSPAEERAKFVGIFAQVCQTLAYAHARGVIHRDLKPSNIMVGAFGEVQVMDWGLAKVLGEGGVADEKKALQRPDVSIIRTQRSATLGSTESSSYTQVGSLLGTPSYLAPEQARGDVDLVDERADVFGLGAILCEILTGSPPYTGRGAETARRAQTAKLDEAWQRLDAAEADDELVTVAKRCLAVETWDRPRNAGEVAQEIAAYQNSVDDRLRQAELSQAAETARAAEALHTAAADKAKATAERRSLRLALALAASILVAVVVVGVGWRRIELDNLSRATALNSRVNAALQEAMRQRGQAQGAAVGNLAPWAAAVTAAKQAEALLEPGVDSALREQVQTLLAEVKTGAKQSEADAQAAERDRQLLDSLVDIRSAKEDDPGGSATDSGYADAFRQAGIDVVALAPAEVAAKLKSKPQTVVLSIAAFLDDWAQVRRGDRKDAEGAKQLTEAAQAIDPDPWRQKLREALGLEDKDKAAALQELAKTALDNDLGPITYDLLGKALTSNDDALAAERVLRGAQQRHPGDVWVNYDLAGALEKLDRQQEAIRYYMVAHGLRPEVGHQLAHALQDVGEPEEAIRVFQELIRLRPKEGQHQSCLAVALGREGRGREAQAAYAAAILALEEQIRLTPDVVKLYNSLGIALAGKGQWQKKIAAFRKAIQINPKQAVYHRHLGSALLAAGQVDEALAACRQAIALAPKNASAQHTLGRALRAKGQYDEAIDCYLEAIKLDPKLGEAHNDLGISLRTRGRLEEAIAAYRKAVELNPKSVPVQSNLGIALRESGRIEEAIATSRKTLELAPKFGRAHDNLVAALKSQGTLDATIADYRAALDRDPKQAVARFGLGVALQASGRKEEAIAAFRQAIELDSQVAWVHHSLGFSLHTNRQLDEAIAAYRKAIKLDPKIEFYHANLGSALNANGQSQEAMAAYQQALVLQPDAFPPRRDLAALLFKAGKHSEALPHYEKAIALRAADVNFYDAACCAALAAAGNDKKGEEVNEQQLARWRKLALDWLRADLTEKRTKQFDQAKAADKEAILKALRWQQNSQLASLRDDAALQKLPAEEQAEWRSLWADVAELLDRAPAVVSP